MKNLNPCDPDDALEYLRTAIFDIKRYGQKDGDSFILPVSDCLKCKFRCVKLLRVVRDICLTTNGVSEEVVFEYNYPWTQEPLEEVPPSEWNKCGSVPSIENVRWEYAGDE
jgi:hypothetical protein